MAGWIESHGRTEDNAEMLAHHHLKALEYAQTNGEQRLELARRAIGALQEAGDRALSLNAYPAAARYYEQALGLVPEGEDERTRCDLLLALGDADGRAGDTPSAQRSFLAAADLAEALGLAEQLAEAALGYGGRFIWEVSRGDLDRVRLLEQALAALGDGDSALRVRLLTRLAGGPLRDASFPPERRTTLSRDALQMARRIGDAETLAFALSGYGAARSSPEHTPEQVAPTTELVELAMQIGDLERATEGYELRLVALIGLGDLPGAKADLAAMRRIAEQLGQPSQQWFVAVYEALVALLEGRLAEAEALMTGARNLGKRAQSWSAEVSYGLQLYLLRREQDRLAEVEELVRRAVEEHPTYPIWRCVLAQMLAELGHTDEARQALDGLAADGFAQVPFDETRLVSLGLWRRRRTPWTTKNVPPRSTSCCSRTAIGSRSPTPRSAPGRWPGTSVSPPGRWSAGRTPSVTSRPRSS